YKGNNSSRISITPGDTIVNLGDLTLLPYSAEYKTNGKKHENAALKWELLGAPVGNIDETTGLVTLTGETGLALVKAEYSNFSASVELLIVDSETDSDINSITIQRVLPDGNELEAKTFNEGEAYKIGGLPFPLDILNGGMLHFPYGCIDEDIVIYMFIPEEYAEIEADSAEINFNEEIITGVKFSVKPADSTDIVEPYYFNIPLNMSMVFNQDLLDSLGIAAEELDVFFADNTGFVSEGTDNVTVDTVKNKIYAAIEHFSTIVVKQKSAETGVSILSETEALLKAYPNPFNQFAKISVQLTNTATIDLAVYNLYGQKVKTLIHEKRQEGNHTVVWDGTNQGGNQVAPGVYFCKFLKDGRRAEAIKLIVNR
ncbi:MAG TPA: FlgD immunoglobulin-like domain containing protein, partial [Prolixibacteraceae bacterium]|nr:FlgD immunoglobulin-like domain containing protein [Prolixibacteraceae bacterium]